jgi:hypothetical protein
MRFRDRLRRAWRWAKARFAAPPPAAPVSPPFPSLSPTLPTPPPPDENPGLPPGEPVVSGDVTLRLWPVAHLVVLATTDAEAERALVTLLSHPDSAVREACTRKLEELRGAHAAAA